VSDKEALDDAAWNALNTIRAMVASRGPDTPNKHYGRAQYNELIACCDTLQEYLDNEGGEEEVTLNELLAEAATAPIEEMDSDELVDAWLTADDLASRMRARLIELKYWWTP